MKQYKILPFALCLLFFACNKQEKIIIDFGYDYFPTEVGKFIEYEVDSILYYRDIQDNTIYQRSNSILVREEIVKSIEGADGVANYVIERYERKAANESWRVTNVWQMQRTENQATRTEENNRFIKLVFPISEESPPWDGNAFIDDHTSIRVEAQEIKPFKNWNYEYLDIHQAKEIGNHLFDSTITVLQANASDFIEHRYSKEVYAKGVGLVAKEMEILDSQCEFVECDVTTPWIEKAERGFRLNMRVTRFN